MHAAAPRSACSTSAPTARLRYRATYHLRSFDYYSSRNYASRLIGRKLVFYTPTLLQPWGGAAAGRLLPGLRRWQGEADAARVRTHPAGHARLPHRRRLRPGAAARAAHRDRAATSAAPRCAASRPPCSARPARVFYVSQGSVYVWTSAWRARRPQPTAPSRARCRRCSASRSTARRRRALKTAGVPIDQLSFLEDGSGHLNVLLRESGRGEGMWGSERTHGAHGAAARAAGRVRRRRAAPRSASTTARCPRRPAGALQNRYRRRLAAVGRRARQRAPARRGLGAALCRRATPQCAAARPWRRAHRGDGRRTPCWSAMPAPTCTSARVRLARGDARAGRPPCAARRRQGETRTHGFFYRPTGARRRPARPAGAARRSGRRGVSPARRVRPRCCSCANAALHFTALGALRARPAAARATTPARPAASTGTATRGRSSSASACSRCSATNWSKAGSWTAPAARAHRGAPARCLHASSDTVARRPLLALQLGPVHSTQAGAKGAVRAQGLLLGYAALPAKQLQAATALLGECLARAAGQAT